MSLEVIIFQIFLCLIALTANMLSAFAGGGAGLIQLPILIFLGLPFSVALATHKLSSVALGIGSTLRHSQEGRLSLKLSLFILLTGLPGVVLGAQSALYIPEKASLILLGIFTVLIGIYSLNQRELGIIETKTRFSKNQLLVGGMILFLIGFLNGSLSSGTGLFVTLWLVRWFGMTYTKAIGYTLILVGMFWNGIGAFVLTFNGQTKWTWLPMLLLGSMIGGYLGSHYSLIKGNRLVKSIFEVISISIGISLVFRGISFSIN